MLQNLGGWKHGTGIKETGEMIPGEMVNQRVVGNLEDFLLKVFQILDTHDLLFRMRIQDHEIAETETLHDLLFQFLRVHMVAGLRRFQHERNDQTRFPYILSELITGIRIFHAIVHKTHIRDNTQHIIPILIKNTYRLLVIPGQFDLRTTPHTQRTLVIVQRLLREHLALLQHERNPPPTR